MPTTHYDLLDIDPGASHQEIKAAWRAKARATHPDLFHSDDDRRRAHEEFIRLSEAYQLLIDEQRRRTYDAGLGAAPPQTRTYRGYENTDSIKDQQEVDEIWKEIWNEVGWRFVRGSARTLLGIVVWGLMGLAMIWGVAVEGTGGMDAGGWFWLLAIPLIFVGLIFEARVRLRIWRYRTRLANLGIRGVVRGREHA